jgi:hypothetical protein
LGAAATQIVCDILLTNVTRRREPAAPEGGGSEAAGAEEADEAEGLGVADGIFASVGVAELGDGLRVAFAAASPPPPTADEADAAAADARCPPAATVPAPPALVAPSAAQPAVSVTAPTSTAAFVSAPDHRARRRLPFRPNITSVLPACIGSVPETRSRAGR